MRPWLILCLCVAALTVPPALTGRVYLAADWLKWFYPWRATGLYDAAPHLTSYGSLQDPILQVYPFEEFAARQLRRGQLPWWDPRSGAGLPLLGMNSLPTWFPGHLVPNLILPPLAARALEQALALLMGGTGMLAFLTRLGRTPPAAALGALTWMLGGWPIAFWQFTSWAWACACLPWGLWSVEGLAQGKPRARVAFALSLSLLALAGSPQLLFLSLGPLGLYALTRLRNRRAWTGALLGGLAGLCLASFVLIPQFEMIRESGRLATAVSTEGRLVPRELVTALFPFYLGDPAEGFYLGGVATSQVVNGREHCLYVGVLPLLLALAGILGGAPRLWGLLLGGALLVALGTPAADLLHLVLPPTRSVPLARTLFLTTLSLSVLCAYGWDSRRSRAFAPLAWTLALLAGGAVLLTIWRVQTDPRAVLTDFVDLAAGGVQKPPYYAGPPYGQWLLGRIVEHFQPWHWHLTLPWLWLALAGLALRWRRAGLALTVVALDLLVYAATMNQALPADLVYPPTPATTTLQAHRLVLPAREPAPRVAGLYRLAHPNGLLTYDLCDVGQYSSLNPQRYRALVEAYDEGPRSDVLIGLFEARRYGPRAADLLGVGAHYTDPFHELPNWCGPGQGSDLRIALRTPPPRWRAVGQALPEQGPPGPDFDPSQAVLLEGGGGGQPGPAGTVTGVLYEANRVAADCRLEREGWVVLTDVWYPGWQARLDGQPVPLLRADYCFRAVRVPAGQHRLEMSYTPTGLGLGLTLGALALVWAAWACWRERPLRHKTP